MRHRTFPREKRFRGDRLRGLRLQAGYKQWELAKKCDIARSQIGNFEGCKHMPSVEILAKLCDVLDVSADYLIGLSDYPGRM